MKDMQVFGLASMAFQFGRIYDQPEREWLKKIRELIGVYRLYEICSLLWYIDEYLTRSDEVAADGGSVPPQTEFWRLVRACISCR